MTTSHTTQRPEHGPYIGTYTDIDEVRQHLLIHHTNRTNWEGFMECDLASLNEIHRAAHS